MESKFDDLKTIMSAVSLVVDYGKEFSAWKKAEEGKARKLIQEIYENWVNLELVIDKGVPLDEVIGDLSVDVYKGLDSEAFKFKTIKKAKIKLPQRLKTTDLSSWQGKRTEALVRSIYDKIIALQIAHFRGAPEGIRWRVRVINICKRIDLLLYHAREK